MDHLDQTVGERLAMLERCTLVAYQAHVTHDVADSLDEGQKLYLGIRGRFTVLDVLTPDDVDRKLPP